LRSETVLVYLMQNLLTFLPGLSLCAATPNSSEKFSAILDEDFCTCVTGCSADPAHYRCQDTPFSLI